MNTRKFLAVGAIVLLAGCQPQVGVVQPFPASVLVQERPQRVVKYADDSRVVVWNDPRVPDNRRLEVLDLPYDPRSEMTIRDVVLGKRHVKLADGHTGVVVTLQPGGEYIDALVGTTRFLADHEIDVGIADPLMVSGALVRLKNRPMLLAREVVWRGKTLRLRDDDGSPLWSSNYNLAEW
jgi:hypothetical protein